MFTLQYNIKLSAMPIATNKLDFLGRKFYIYFFALKYCFKSTSYFYSALVESCSIAISLSVYLWVCVSVCVCVCLSASISPEPLDRSPRNLLCRCLVAVTRSSSGGIAMCYVLPVLRMTSRLAVEGRMAMRGQRHCETGVESDVYECFVIQVTFVHILLVLRQ